MADRVAAIANQLNPRSGPGPLLQGEVAIITGSGQGIGKAAALLFAAHGASVVVSDLDASRTHATTEEITKAGGKAIGVPGDVMAADYGEKIVAATIKAFGKINHIINNAGFTADKMTHTMDDDTFRLMLECHAVAPFRIIRAAAPHMRIKDQSKRENRSIVNVSCAHLGSVIKDRFGWKEYCQRSRLREDLMPSSPISTPLSRSLRLLACTATPVKRITVSPKPV